MIKSKVFKRGVSSAGRALASHARGQGFESPTLHHFIACSESALRHIDASRFFCFFISAYHAMAAQGRNSPAKTIKEKAWQLCLDCRFAQLSCLSLWCSKSSPFSIRVTMLTLVAAGVSSATMPVYSIHSLFQAICFILYSLFLYFIKQKERRYICSNYTGVFQRA